MVGLIVGITTLMSSGASAATTHHEVQPDKYVVVYDGQPISELASIGFDAEKVPTRISNGTEVADIKSLTASQSVRGTECGGFKPCGVVHNKTSVNFTLKRDANSHWSCGGDSPYKNLSPGHSSSGVWPDTDCFTTTVGKIFYAPAGGWVSAGNYIRIWNHVWVYEFSW